MLSTSFQPTLPARGATRSDVRRSRYAKHFNPRSPHGERHSLDCQAARLLDEFQPTLPARGATGQRHGRSAGMRISTHAPRTGSDITGSASEWAQTISTHAPRTGSDKAIACLTDTLANFNPRSPHGERPTTFADCPTTRRISTHAPRTGSDFAPIHVHTSKVTFQPTLPARGAT